MVIAWWLSAARRSTSANCRLWIASRISGNRSQLPNPLVPFIGVWHYLFMSYVEGTPPAKVWPELSSDLKVSVQSQLEQILCHLRKVLLPSGFLGGGSSARCKDLRRFLRVTESEIKSEVEFNSFLTRTDRKFNPVYLELATANLSTSHQVVMTHGDLSPETF